VRVILLDMAKPGDELAAPVTNEKGMLILPKGAKLTMGSIDSLRRRGIVEITVEGRDPNAPPPKTTNEFLADLDVRFEGLESNPTMMSIKAFAREHILARDRTET
jgi:hypothetical protein